MLLAGVAAGATSAGLLPANPRVPAAVAAVTLAFTTLYRYCIGGPEPMLFAESLKYSGPADSCPWWEAAICSANVAWGLWGFWLQDSDPKSPQSLGN